MGAVASKAQQQTASLQNTCNKKIKK